MTEATHQMASQPLPPGVRKPGRVGLAAGPEVAIMDEAGHLLPAGEVGEIVIRGPTSPPATRTTTRPMPRPSPNGWFRTGDQGQMDAEGYVTLTGRLKEIINRGGEKVEPARGRRRS